MEKCLLKGCECAAADSVGCCTLNTCPTGLRVETNIYDVVEEHHNCFVQILTNSVTGETSIGWKKEEEA